MLNIQLKIQNRDKYIKIKQKRRKFNDKNWVTLTVAKCKNNGENCNDQKEFSSQGKIFCVV